MWKHSGEGTGYLGSLWLFSCLRVHQQEGSNDDLSNYWYEEGTNPRRSLKQSCFCYRGFGWADYGLMGERKRAPTAFQGVVYPWKPRYFRILNSVKPDSSPSVPLPSPPQKKVGASGCPIFWILWDPLKNHPEKQTTRCATGPSRLSVVDQRLWAYERKLTKALKALRQWKKGPRFGLFI